jgi:succinoglycan biosynthesis transport protein ExoP
VSDRFEERRGRRAGADSALEIWARRKWIALAAFGAVAVAAASIASALPDLFRATATVLVETEQVSEAFVRPSVTAELETRIQTIRQEIMSRSRLGTLIGQFDLYPEARKKGASFDEIIEQMRRDINLEVRGVDQPIGGRLPMTSFAISFMGRDADLVARVANELASLYVAENTKIREGQAVRAAEFLKSQLADVKKQLDEQDQLASRYKLSHIGELPQQVEANLASLERLNTQLRLNGENQIRAMDRKERLERQLADIKPGPVPTVTAGTSRDDQLAKLTQRLADLKRQFTDEYPDVVRVRAEIAALEQTASQVPAHASASSPDIDPKSRLQHAIGEVDAELTALRREEAVVRQAIAGYEQRVENVPKRQEEYQALSRDYATTKERYDTLLKRYEEAQLAASLEQARNVEQFRVLDAAIPPREPVAPNRIKVVVGGFVLAVALAIGLVLLTERLDTTFHTVDDLRSQTTVPTLFSIPVIHTASDGRRHRHRFVLAAASALIALAAIVAGSHYVATGNEQIARLVGRGRM